MEGLAESGADEPELAVERAGGVVAVQDPEPGAGHAGRPQVPEHLADQPGGNAGAAGVGRHPEVAEIAVRRSDVRAGRGAEHGEHGVTLGDEDQPDAVAHLLVPGAVLEPGFGLVRGQIRGRRLAEGAESDIAEEMPLGPGEKSNGHGK